MKTILLVLTALSPTPHGPVLTGVSSSALNVLECTGMHALLWLITSKLAESMIFWLAAYVVILLSPALAAKG